MIYKLRISVKRLELLNDCDNSDSFAGWLWSDCIDWIGRHIHALVDGKQRQTMRHIKTAIQMALGASFIFIDDLLIVAILTALSVAWVLYDLWEERRK